MPKLSLNAKIVLPSAVLVLLSFIVATSTLYFLHAQKRDLVEIIAKENEAAKIFALVLGTKD